ncbi:MAG: hypothetical protein IKP64_10150 [Selenomonadaceae bacterium]|nr:hypothetical protein [Selenomonadaceae bacterium]MBR4383905.1 hypothetical protein [Selenomonadaceae bacterium]
MGKADMANKLKNIVRENQNSNSGGVKKLGDAKRESAKKTNTSGEKESGRK